MRRLTFSDLPRLVDASQEACVSLYIGGGRMGLYSGPTLQTYRHSLRRVEAALRVRCGKEVRDAILTSLSVYSSLQSSAPRAQGLAVFGSPSSSGWFPIHEPIETSLVVAGSFHIKPLLPFLDPSQRWYLLDVRADHVRLHECARGQGEEVGRHALGVERLRHSDSGLPAVARWMQGLIPLERVPLMVRAPADLEAALSPLVAKSTLGAAFLPGPTVGVHEEAVVAEAWTQVQAPLEEKRAQLFARLRHEAVNGRAVTTPQAALERLRERRLSALAVRPEAHLWGAIDWKNGRISLGQDRGEPFGDCVLDDIAERALRERCKVLVARRGELPHGADLVAL